MSSIINNSNDIFLVLPLFLFLFLVLSFLIVLCHVLDSKLRNLIIALSLMTLIVIVLCAVYRYLFNIPYSLG